MQIRNSFLPLVHGSGVRLTRARVLGRALRRPEPLTIKTMKNVINQLKQTTVKGFFMGLGLWSAAIIGFILAFNDMAK